MISKINWLVILFSAFLTTAGAGSLTLHSPSENIEVQVDVAGDSLHFRVLYEGVEVLEPSRIGLRVDGKEPVSENNELTNTVRNEVDAWHEPVVRQKSARVHEQYRSLKLEFGDVYAVEFRAFDDGVAYRFETALEGTVEVDSEQMELHFPSNSTTLFPEEESILSHNERTYMQFGVEELDAERFASLPLMVEVEGKIKMLITEADLWDYPALWLKGGEGVTLQAKFSSHVLEAIPDPKRPDRTQILKNEADYIAKTEGTRSFPWRTFIISDRDGTFIESQMVYLLSEPLRLKDTSWIQPGRVAWDWYNSLNIYGVDFKSGINNATYRYYIDFAAKYGLEYIILDEGWSVSTTDISQPCADIDVEELVAYGAERGVGVILWGLWEPVQKDMEKLFALYESWGVKGVKIDFMQRSDQGMVNFYARAAEVAAKHRLLVDFHGSFKPTGLIRAYPNVMTYEGVKGNEHNKWSEDITAKHNLTIPFIRMVAGPMDYTPGAMRNAQPADFRIVRHRPMSLTTRSHEVAKYVVFESPLQMFCDTPSRYYQEHEVTQFIAKIPVVWDDTWVLDAKVGDYVLIARRSGNQWFLAAMTDENSRELKLDLSFLPEKKYRVEVIRDGINANRFAEDYALEVTEWTNEDVIHIKLEQSGGWTAILEADE